MAVSCKSVGEWRAVSCVLLDEPEFQRLTPEQRWLNFVLSISLGGARIGVVNAPEAVLAARTGLAEGDVSLALKALCKGGWIELDTNVLWVKDGLRRDPTYNSNNRNHRVWVQRAVASLPKLPIVGRFVAAYPEWFVDLDTDVQTPSSPPSEGQAKAYRIPSEAEERVEDIEEPNREKEREREREEQRAGSSSIVSSIVEAANRGIHRNVLIDTPKHALNPSDERNLQASRQLEGIPLKFVLASVEGKAASYRPKTRGAQPTSLAYFVPAVKEDWAKAQVARQTSAQVPSDAPVSSFCRWCEGKRVGAYTEHSADCTRPIEHDSVPLRAELRRERVATVGAVENVSRP